MNFPLGDEGEICYNEINRFQNTMTIDLRHIEATLRDKVRALATRIQRAGGRAWLVGGSVRDMLLGRAVTDVDFEVHGLAPDKLEAVIGEADDYDACGLSFGVLKIAHWPIDIALPRRESKRGLGHKGFLINSDPFLSIDETAQRRDFTINALYFDPLSGELADPCGGLADLETGVLRHVSAHFVEDPLRVLRGMQFIARFDLKPAPETVALCQTMTPEGLASERQFEEWSKLLVSGKRISAGLDFLRATGWVKYYPELAALSGCLQNPEWHFEGDVWAHTCLCLDSFARDRIGDATEDLIVGLAVLCHDFGKPLVSKKDTVTGRIRSLGHDVAGLAPTRAFLRRLTNEERILKEVPRLVETHMQPFSLWQGKSCPAAIRRLAVRVGRIDRLIRVCQADSNGSICSPTNACQHEKGIELKWLAAEAEKLRVADAAPKPILMGRHLIELGYKPSSQFKKLLNTCFEAQLDGAFTDLDGAIAYFKENCQ